MLEDESVLIVFVFQFLSDVKLLGVT